MDVEKNRIKLPLRSAFKHTYQQLLMDARLVACMYSVFTVYQYHLNSWDWGICLGCSLG